jgi:hypothetical protein
MQKFTRCLIKSKPNSIIYANKLSFILQGHSEKPDSTKKNKKER